jgi:hypothetical protein
MLLSPGTDTNNIAVVISNKRAPEDEPYIG